MTDSLLQEIVKKHMEKGSSKKGDLVIRAEIASQNRNVEIEIGEKGKVLVKYYARPGNPESKEIVNGEINFKSGGLPGLKRVVEEYE